MKTRFFAARREVELAILDVQDLMEAAPEAEMTFSKAGDKILIVDHTGVPDELGGMGVGKALVEYMVMDVRARGLKVVPLCPFTNATLRKHSEWQDILKDPF